MTNSNLDVVPGEASPTIVTDAAVTDAAILGAAASAVVNAGPDAMPVHTKKLSPTDLSQYLRLDNCERYLRLQMHERSEGSGFLTQRGAGRQTLQPLLTRSGLEFEQRLEAQARACQRFPILNFQTLWNAQAASAASGGKRLHDNAALAQAARDLAPGQTLLCFQPRLHVTLGAWRITGDVDILRLERDSDGHLRALIADMKSATRAKVEHRMQVALYHAMIAELFRLEAVDCAEIQTAILFRGPAHANLEDTDPDAARRMRDAAERLMGAQEGYLEIIADADAYLAAIDDMVIKDDSLAQRVSAKPFSEVFYHLSYKCDGCVFNEFCMKDTFERSDLSHIPFLSARDKRVLQQAGLNNAQDLAQIKQPRPSQDNAAQYKGDLIAHPDHADRVRGLSATSVGPRLDEIVLRARSLPRSQKLGLNTLSYIPGKGHSTLPHSDADVNPDLIRIYVDAQHDYLQDRIYLIGTRIVANRGGAERHSVTLSHLAQGPVDTPGREQTLLADWIKDLLAQAAHLADPDAPDAVCAAPIHLIFWNRFGQRLLLDALARCASHLLASAPALYDFMTQLAAFEAPVTSFLEDEIREHKNLPLACQSLQSVSRLWKFDWKEGGMDTVFHARLFDDGAKQDDEFFTLRARYNSQIPLEYAYTAWNELQSPGDDARVRAEQARYAGATPALLRRFQERRMEALEHIAGRFQGNRQEKPCFDLSLLARFSDRAAHLAQALREFLLIERHVSLSEWRGDRQATPERRVLMGETLLARYSDANQEQATLARNAQNAQAVAAGKSCSMQDMRLRLRLEAQNTGIDLAAALALNTLRVGDYALLCPRAMDAEGSANTSFDARTPSPRQMLYHLRVTIDALVPVETDAQGRVTAMEVHVTGAVPMQSKNPPGYLFASAAQKPFVDGGLYTLDGDPNDINGFWQAKVCGALCDAEAAQAAANTAANAALGANADTALGAGAVPVQAASAGPRPVGVTAAPLNGTGHALYDRLAAPAPIATHWNDGARAGQARFLAGLRALAEVGGMDVFEDSKCRYVGAHGDDALLLVQGPPGTGKSFSTAYAVYARMQGAMAGDLPLRALLSCKTNDATDVLLRAVHDAQARMRGWRIAYPALWTKYFDDRLLDVPLMRLGVDNYPLSGVVALSKTDKPRWAGKIQESRRCITASTPGGIYGAVEKTPRSNTLLRHHWSHLVVLDEASQMSLPEAMMSTLPLAPGGQLIVVGDPRQMPPIVTHDWKREPRRTFQAFRSYESLYEALLARAPRPPQIQFEESFRLHRDMAEFLRQEIYQRDGIAYHSRRTELLPPRRFDDAFTQAVLAGSPPLVVIVHDEESSQNLNPFEMELVTPLIHALRDPAGFGLDTVDGMGVVVPHRAQRAALLERFPDLAGAVDVVERYQGGEREVILVSATESDPDYIQVNGEFMLNPRRLTVALSRGKKKMILVASRSVFALMSSDEETFLNSQIWKNLLRRTCVHRLWQGQKGGHQVTVWGNAPLDAPQDGGQ